MTAANENEVADLLRLAATSYVIALDAQRLDAIANLDALGKGEIRQLSSNAIEAHTRFGALTTALDLARKHLQRDEIGSILEEAMGHTTYAADAAETPLPVREVIADPERLDTLPAESVVLVPCGLGGVGHYPSYRGRDGLWYSHGVTGKGSSGEQLVRNGGSVTLLYTGDRPVWANMTQIEGVRAEAKRLGWRKMDSLSSHAKFGRGLDYIVVRYSGSGRVTRARRLWPGGDDLEVTTNVLATVLTWLEEEQS